jgi:hypothetical protein
VFEVGQVYCNSTYCHHLYSNDCIFEDGPVYLAGLTPRERQYIEQAFLDSYNKVGEDYCDPFFRTATNVEKSELVGYDVYA